MPRYFCDYCQTYLTHDSPSGRQQHMRGKQHRDRFKAWFEPVYIEWARSNPQSSSYSGNYGAGQPPMMHQHPPGYPQQSNPYGNYGVPPMGLPPPDDPKINRHRDPLILCRCKLRQSRI